MATHAVDLSGADEYVPRAFGAFSTWKRLYGQINMSNKNGTSSSKGSSSDLTALEVRVKAAQERNKPKDYSQNDDGSLLGMAWRLSTELVVSILVGMGLGYGLDVLFGTKPWCLFIGLGFGFAAGIKSVLATADKMDAKTANIPIGEDMTDFDDEQDY